MKTSVHNHLPFVLALVAVLWCVWIGVRIWTTPLVWEGVVTQVTEDGVQQPPTTVREVKSFRDVSHLSYFPLAVPVILAAWAALVARLRAPAFLTGIVLLFQGYVFIAGFSIGSAYHGAAALLAVAVLADIALSRWDARHPAETLTPT